jgi:hypothetical protein
MAKKVLVIDNKVDLIADDFEYLMGCLDHGGVYNKKSDTSVSFSLMSLDPALYGILWFNSRDYTNLIPHVDKFVFEGQKRVLALQAGFGISNEQVIEQGKELTTKLLLDNHESVYLKLKATSPEQVIEDITEFATKLNCLSRVQLSFEEGSSVQRNMVIASKAVSIASKFRLRANSCSLGTFNEKNNIVGHEPCVSAFSMQTLLNTSMTKKADTSNTGECGCHKYVNFSGCGTKYDSRIHKVKVAKVRSDKGY